MSDKKICTKETPMPTYDPTKPIEPWYHRDSKLYQDKHCSYYECPNCGHRWRLEIPQ